MRKHLSLGFCLALLTASIAVAQHGPEGPPPPSWHRPPMEHSFRNGHPGGRWWANPQMQQKLGLTTDQQKKMDEVFQQSRLKLIDLHASLQKEEIILEPLISADQPDESKIISQIDRIAQARAELEKSNARMLLGLRRTLTPEQWKQLQTMSPRDRSSSMRHCGGPDGAPDSKVPPPPPNNPRD